MFLSLISVSPRRFSLFSTRKQKDDPTDDIDAVLERQKRVQQNRLEAWRLELPKDLEHPLSIKRSIDVNRRRVTFANIYTASDEYEHREIGRF